MTSLPLPPSLPLLTSLPLFPAKAGIQGVKNESRRRVWPLRPHVSFRPWVPAFAGKCGEGI